MALLLFNTGIIEEIKPKNLVFVENEINEPFIDYIKIRSKRVIEVPNVWCVWGESEKTEDIEYNRLASELNEEHIYSSVLFIHDSEINPEWNLTDKIILKDYKTFSESIKNLLDKIAEEILATADANVNKTEEMILTTLGYTDDKKILFGFDPLEQPKNFYTNISFFNFATQINDYLNLHLKNLKKPFIIYADKKMIISVDDNKVNNLLDEMINLFGKKEKYEICSKLSKIKDEWTIVLEKDIKTIKKRRNKKSTDNSKGE